MRWRSLEIAHAAAMAAVEWGFYQVTDFDRAFPEFAERWQAGYPA
jgi:hypothetical protein